MGAMREEQRVGLEYLETVTSLLQRARNAHPTKGLFEAAEFHWWWSNPRATDDLPQLFWFDDDGQPEAALIITTWGSEVSAVYTDSTITPLFMPDASPAQVALVIERGIAYATESGIDVIGLEVDRADDVMRDLLFDRGFTVKEEALIEGWLDVNARPDVSPLHDGYRLVSRAEATQFPHHMADAKRPDIEKRLLQTSLYRPELDLVVLDRDDNPAAYGMFWHDPGSKTGVVEPMRTHDDHQKRGLARHVLTAGIDRLAQAGAEHISIGWEPDNPASGHLYMSVGFEPHQHTDLLSRG